jgi:predicted thioesterase
MDVEITVTVAEIDRSKVVFDVSATDPVDVICTGQHERFVVDVERTRQRLRAKAAKAAEAA